jgi:hypothetical protein
MGDDSDVNRRKFLEIGLYGISGTLAAVSGIALTRLAKSDHNGSPSSSTN